MLFTTPEQDLSVNGDFETTDFQMGDTAIILDLFADKIYTHKERAVIREYCCNAHDSHVMAGTEHIPFDVHLPTRLEPFFSVRDYGIGLSDREVRTIFAGIAVSSKRDNNKTIGCFGLGSKSAFSMSDSFTVKSYHNGTVRTYTCYRDDQRRPVVAMLIEDETDEKNGLEVSVSVDGRVYAFEEEAKNVFRFWEGTLPNINNKQIACQQEENDKKYILKGQDFGLTSTYGDMHAIMGNISYKIPRELVKIDCEGYVKFSLGELEFDTARENLSMTDKVRKAITDKFAEVKEKAVKLAIAQIASETTTFKRAVLASRFNKGTLGNILKPDMKNYTLPDTSTDIDCWEAYYGRAARRIQTRAIPLVSDRGNNKVEYYAHKPRMTQRIKDYAKNNNTLVVVLTEQQIAECQIDRDLIRDLDNLPKLQRASSLSKGTSQNTFILVNKQTSYFNEHSWKPVSIDDNSVNEMIYVDLDRWTPNQRKLFICDIINMLDKMDIVVPKIHGLRSSYTKSKGFKSVNWINFYDYAKREMDKIVGNKKVYKYNSQEACKIRSIGSSIESDQMTEWKSLQKSQELSDSDSKQLIEYTEKLGVILNVDNSIQEWMDSFFKDYPMLTLLDEWKISSNSEIVADYLGGKLKTA